MGGEIIVTIGDDGLCTFFACGPEGHHVHGDPVRQDRPRARATLHSSPSVPTTACVMTTKEREVLLWTLKTPFHSIGGHRARITAIAASPLHRLFASADASGEVKLWGYDGNLLGETTDAKQAVRGLVFSHDASMLVGIGDDARTFVWNSALGIARRVARARRRVRVGRVGRDRDRRFADRDRSTSNGDRVASVAAAEREPRRERTGVGIAVARSHRRHDRRPRARSCSTCATGNVVKQFAIRHAPTKRREGFDRSRPRAPARHRGRHASADVRPHRRRDLRRSRPAQMIRDIIHDDEQ